MDNIETQFTRTEILIGKDKSKSLSKKRVALFGIGGVGGYAAEALARSGIGTLDLIDNDVVSVSNINRQIIALHSTIGRAKVEVMKERIYDINPNAIVNTKQCFFLPDNSSDFNFSEYDYVIDAVDTISAKIEIVMCSQKNNIPMISCMGAGNKLNPLGFTITDIYKTKNCPLAKVMRKELNKRGVKSLKVVFSEELPVNKGMIVEGNKKSIPGSISFVPSAAGLIIAGEVIRDLIKL